MDEREFILKDVDYDDEIAEIKLQRKVNSPYEYTITEDYCDEYGCFKCFKCKELINIY